MGGIGACVKTERISARLVVPDLLPQSLDFGLVALELQRRTLEARAAARVDARHESLVLLFALLGDLKLLLGCIMFRMAVPKS